MTISESRLRQYLHESEGWKRTLAFMMEENARQKDRMAEILQCLPDRGGLLETAEQFQNSFVSEDETIRLLRRDIAALDKMISKEILELGGPGQNIPARKKKIAAGIRDCIVEFSKLSFEFNNYLSDVL